VISSIVRLPTGGTQWVTKVQVTVSPVIRATDKVPLSVRAALLPVIDVQLTDAIL